MRISHRKDESSLNQPNKDSWIELIPPCARLGDSEIPFVALTKSNLLEILETLDHSKLLEIGFSTETANNVMETVAPVVKRHGMDCLHETELLTDRHSINISQESIGTDRVVCLEMANFRNEKVRLADSVDYSDFHF